MSVCKSVFDFTLHIIIFAADYKNDRTIIVTRFQMVTELHSQTYQNLFVKTFSEFTSKFGRKNDFMITLK